MSMAFLFPGQGAQSVGMCQSLHGKYACAKALFDRASEILGYDLAKLCFEGPKEQLDSTVYSQPALFVSSLAALEMLKEVKPDLVASATHTAGLSLGEYTALVFAEAISFEDGLKVVKQRGQAMQDSSDRSPSGMASLLMLERDKVQAICDEASAVGQVLIANYLCPGNLVISGEKPAVAKAVELAEAAGGKTITLAVAGAFHTRNGMHTRIVTAMAPTSVRQVLRRMASTTRSGRMNCFDAAASHASQGRDDRADHARSASGAKSLNPLAARYRTNGFANAQKPTRRPRNARRSAPYAISADHL